MTDRIDASPRRNWVPWTLASGALLVGCFAGAMVFDRVSLHRGPLLSWDEGGYVWKAHFTALGIRTGDAPRIWRSAAADRLNPPLNALLPASVFLVFGESESTALGFTAACLAACALLIGLIAWDLGGAIAAVVAVLGLLGSRLHLEYAATAMLEVPGTALTLLAVWLYIRHLRKPRPSSAWWAGIGFLLVFFYKYNFGVLLVAAVAVSEALRRPFRPLGAATRGLWMPLAVAAALWFAIPGKLPGFLDFAGNRDSRLGWLQSVLFYPRALIGYYSAWLPSGMLTALAALSAIALRRRDGVRFLLLFAGIGLLGMTIHRYKLERSIVTIVPALWILSGAALAELFRRLGAARLWIRVAVTIAVAVTLLGGLPRLYARDLPAIARHLETGVPHAWSRFSWPGRDLLPARDLILDRVDPGMPVYVAGEFNELPPMTIQWWFARRYPRTKVISRCFQADAPLAPPLNLVTIEVLPASPYFGEDYRVFNAWALEPIHAVERSGVIPAVDTTLHDAGLRVRIYPISASR